MSTNNDGWILMSERKPIKADLPVWVYYQNGQREVILNMWFPPKDATHWKPAAADIPAPPREKTQAEKDVAEFNRIHGESVEMTPVPRDLKENHAGRRIGWFSALAYERAEVGKMLPQIECVNRNGQSVATVYDRSHQSACEAIRARCGGGK